MSDIFEDQSIEIFEEFENNIIVGNAPIILNSNYGKYIDSFDCVVRLNNAEIEGYEEDVGEKETFRVLNKTLQKGVRLPSSNVKESYLETFEEQNLILYPSHERIENTAKESIDQTNQIFVVSKEFRSYLDDLKDFFSLKKLSTGLFSVILFIHIFGESILINFDFYSNSEDSFHYWEDFGGGDNSLHDFEKEAECISNLSESGQVKLVKL